MKQKFKQNLDLKVLSILFSVVIWMVVVNIDDPVKSVQFNDVPIVMTNDSVLEEKGLVYEVIDSIESVDVVVSGRRSVIEELSKDDIVVSADFEKMTDNNEVPLTVSSSKYSSDIDGMKTDSDKISVEIEELKKVQKVIQVEAIGTPAEGFITGDHTINLNQVHIEGPASVIDDIAKAIVQVDVEGVVNNVSASAPIILLDSKGSPVDTSRLSLNINTISVTQEILFTKTIPVVCNPGGTPADGYQMTGEVEITPAEVTVCGKKSVVDGISQVTVSSNLVDVTGEKSDLVTNVNVSGMLPYGVELENMAMSGNVKITVKVEKEVSKKESLPMAKISVEGVPEGKNAEIVDNSGNVIDGKIEIEVWGIKESVDAMNSSSIDAYVDLGEYMKHKNISMLQNGVIEVPVTLEMPDGIHTKEDKTVYVRISNIT